MRLDHIVVGCADLQSGTDWLEARLQVPAGGGGEHVGYGTHNRLWRLDANRYLELIALQPGAECDRTPLFGLGEQSVRDRLASGPRLLSWVALAPNDLPDDSVIAGVPGLAAPVSVRRGDFQWRLAVQSDGGLCDGGVMPYIIWWQPPHPTDALPESGLALTELSLHTPNVEPLRRLLADDAGREPVCVSPGAHSLVAHLSGPAGQVVID